MNIMSELEKYIEQSEKAKGDDERLAAIMTDMERKYKIPILAKWLPDWQGKPLNATRVFEIYKYISGLRKF